MNSETSGIVGKTKVSTIRVYLFPPIVPIVRHGEKIKYNFVKVLGCVLFYRLGPSMSAL